MNVHSFRNPSYNSIHGPGRFINGPLASEELSGLTKGGLMLPSLYVSILGLSRESILTFPDPEFAMLASMMQF